MRTIDNPRPAGGSLLTDPRARAWLFQILAVITVVAFGWYLFHNTQTNLAHRGITSGFGFLENAAGFGISQHLIDYSESDTYGRVFWVGLLNTLLVSVIGIFLATVMGFILGVGRLSSNWLIRQLATLYIEIFRNIPPLLLIFFVYFAVISPLPGPRNSLSLWDAVFVNNRGVQMPAPSAADGFWSFWLALLVAVVAVVLLNRWARARRHATGQMFPVLWTSLGLFLAIPWLMTFIAGVPFTWEVPELQRFNIRGGWVVIPELVSIVVALSVYTAAFIGETVRSGIQSVSHGQTEAASLRARLTWPGIAAGHRAASVAGDRAAADQPIPEPRKELVARCCYRLSGHGVAVRRHGAQSDRAGYRNHGHHHECLSGHQHQHLAADELVQQAHCADRAVSA